MMPKTTLTFASSSLLLSSLILVTTGQQQQQQSRNWTGENFPQPLYNPDACGNSGSRICDPDSVLTPPRRLALHDMSKSILKRTREKVERIKHLSQCLKQGLDIYIVLVAKVQGISDYGELVAADMRTFAQNVKESWHLASDPECDNTLLITISLKDRQIFSLPGRNTQISIENADQIYRNNKFYFTDGKYFDGIRSMQQAFQGFWLEKARTISVGFNANLNDNDQIETEDKKPTSNSNAWWIWLVAILIILILFIGCFLCLYFTALRSDQQKNVCPCMAGWFGTKSTSSTSENSSIRNSTEIRTNGLPPAPPVRTQSGGGGNILSASRILDCDDQRCSNQPSNQTNLIRSNGDRKLPSVPPLSGTFYGRGVEEESKVDRSPTEHDPITLPSSIDRNYPGQRYQSIIEDGEIIV